MTFTSSRPTLSPSRLIKKVAIGDRRRRQSSKEGQRSRPEGHTESRGLRHRNSAWGDAPKILSRMPGVPVGEYSADTQQRLAVDVADRRAKPMKQYGHKCTSCAFVHRGAHRRPGGESFRVFVVWGPPVTSAQNRIVNRAIRSEIPNTHETQQIGRAHV